MEAEGEEGGGIAEEDIMAVDLEGTGRTSGGEGAHMKVGGPSEGGGGGLGSWGGGGGPHEGGGAV